MIFSNKSNKTLKFLITCIISIILEICIFNFDYLRLISQNNLPKNVELTLDNAALVNWKLEGEENVSSLDPMIIFEDININAKKVSVEAKTSPNITNLTLFYTTNENEEFGSNHMIVVDNSSLDGKYLINLDKKICDLRIDLGETADTHLKNFTLIINPAVLNISSARIIAMIIIYYSAKGLLSLQKQPNYKIL